MDQNHALLQQLTVSSPELDKLVIMMTSDPGMKIELQSHTDCRQTDKYNLKLSQKRADEVVKYLVSKGISSSRMEARGYGESLPVKKCDCDDQTKEVCSEEDHQLNRRTEFRVLPMREIFSMH